MSDSTSKAAESEGVPSSSDTEELSHEKWSKQRSNQWLLLLKDLKRLDICDPIEGRGFRLKWRETFQGEQIMLLHQFATTQQVDISYEKLKFVVGVMLESHSEELKWREGDLSYTPLHSALETDNHLFTKTVLEVCTPTMIKSMIQKPTESFPTLLHQAISIGSPFTADIIASCSSEPLIFSARDSLGRTPLHLAVEPVHEEIFPSKQRHKRVSTTYPETGGKSKLDSTFHPMLPVFSSYDTVRHLTISSPEALLLKDKALYTPYRRRVQCLQDLHENMGLRSLFHPNHQESPGRNFDKVINEDAILSFLLYHIIRNLTFQNIATALYQPGQERDVGFDMSRVGGTLSRNFLEMLGRNVPFERVLKRVILPNMKADTPGSVGYNGTVTLYPGPNKKTAFQLFSLFREWKIRKIMEVVVDDWMESYHSDEIIQNSLEGFEVETLNWKRNDIPSEVFSNSSGAIKHLRLHFSGKKEVFDDWCGGGGFGNESLFPELRSISVVCATVKKGQAERLRLTACVDTFKRAIEFQTSGRVKVSNAEHLSSHWVDEALASEQTLQRINPWLSSMMDFVKLLETAPDAQTMEPIRVAIITDGLNLSHLRGAAGNVVRGMSFSAAVSSVNDADQLYEPWYVSKSNDGTDMVTAISAICPKVNFHVAKVDQRAKDWSTTLEKAVLWAVSCEVDIIVLGCKLYETSHDVDETAQGLIKAIHSAANKRILTFCMPNDFAAIGGGCIRIGVTTTSDQEVSYSSQVDIMWPFRHIPFVHSNGQIVSRASGIPVAIAMASGLASLLIFCNRLLSKDDNGMDLNYMRWVFHRMSKQTGGHPVVTASIGENFRLALLRLHNESDKAIDLSSLRWNEECREALEQTIMDLSPWR